MRETRLTAFRRVLAILLLMPLLLCGVVLAVVMAWWGLRHDLDAGDFSYCSMLAYCSTLVIGGLYGAIRGSRRAAMLGVAFAVCAAPLALVSTKGPLDWVRGLIAIGCVPLTWGLLAVPREAAATWRQRAIEWSSVLALAVPWALAELGYPWDTSDLGFVLAKSLAWPVLIFAALVSVVPPVRLLLTAAGLAPLVLLAVALRDGVAPTVVVGLAATSLSLALIPAIARPRGATAGDPAPAAGSDEAGSGRTDLVVFGIAGLVVLVGELTLAIYVAIA